VGVQVPPRTQSKIASTCRIPSITRSEIRKDPGLSVGVQLPGDTLGGGRGGLLAEILTRYPRMHGVLFDQPDVVACATAVLDRAGVSDRCQLVGGDFFRVVPDVKHEGRAALILKAVIHDWPDDDSIAILGACHRAMGGTCTLLLLEQLLDDGPDPSRTAFSDLTCWSPRRQGTHHQRVPRPARPRRFPARQNGTHGHRRLPPGSHAYLTPRPDPHRLIQPRLRVCPTNGLSGVLITGSPPAW